LKYKVIFPSQGLYLIQLTANNLISNQTTQKTIYASSIQPYLYFFDSTFGGNISASKSNAQFLFRISFGQSYECTIDFGDNTPQLAIDNNLSQTNYNNTIITHFYQNVAIYLVNASCNLDGTYLNLNYVQMVEEKISGLCLLQNGMAKVASFFQIGFQFQSGSDMSIQFYLNSILDNQITFDQTSLTGYSSLIVNNGVASVLNVTIRAQNNVSSVMLNQLFEIGSQIVSPSLSITTSGVDSSSFYFGTSINFFLNARSGSNIRVRVFYGDEIVTNMASFDQVIVGDWQNTVGLGLSHLYGTPGQYKIIAIFSNYLGSYNLSTQTIKYFNLILIL
jgi:hypothetical protein